ncbi:MAG: hypothetical protein KGN76_10295 [Acidobacteriota bacterium]|nr:hypothetical protein [Acidobacteriota bacterium]
MTADLEGAVAALAADRESGASTLLARAVVVLQQARAAGGGALERLAPRVARTQPAMAPMWLAAGLALADAQDAGDRLDRFVRQAGRALEAVARLAADLVEAERPGGAEMERRVVTCSFSQSVLGACRTLAARRPLVVACAEGRPALEGRRLAAALAGSGIAAVCYADAAVGVALGGSLALLVGADAVTPDWFVNKVGTGALAALAVRAGIPVYVLAARDKFLPAGLAPLLTLRGGAAEEIWAGPPAGVEVRNPYFEPVPLDLVSALVTDSGVVEAGLAGAICEANGRWMGRGLELLRSSVEAG